MSGRCCWKFKKYTRVSMKIAVEQEDNNNSNHSVKVLAKKRHVQDFPNRFMHVG